MSFMPHLPHWSLTINSMDAISFVLGIKSSHLRSSHLRDLVYRGRVLKTSKINDDGSAVARATGAEAEGSDNEETQTSTQAERNDPKTAWVMAVYEDDAGDEQHWRRSINSSGSSEYKINNRSVSAQQYNDALESENILIKARNFLVFQGDVEAIASQSPKDLTRLIEQISGSLEYKAEYERLQEESELATENQTNNLHRRRGINSEIKQYQEQKKEAENYQNKAEERDAAIVTHILWKLFHFQRVMEDSSIEIQRHQEELKEYRRGVEKYEKGLEDTRKEQAKVSKDVGKAERDIKKTERDIEEKENSLVPIDEKIDQLNKASERTKRRVPEVSKERDSQASSISGIKKDLSIVEKAQKQFEDQWKESMKKQGRQLNEADLREYARLRAQVNTRTSADQAKLDNLSRQLKTDEVTMNSLKSKVDASKNQVEKLESEVEIIEGRKNTTNDLVKQVSKEIDGKKKELNTLSSERTRNDQSRTEVEEKLQHVLKALVDADDGKRQNDKEVRTKETVAALRRLYPGVRGRIGELCKPKQKKFDEAVITALGRDFDSVVVDTEKTGTECVQYLKEQRAGQMTFIPLDNIKVNAVNSSLKGLSKARLTIDTIDFDSSLERAMSYACGNSIVCDDLATAKHICYDKGVQVKAVTLEGFVIHKAGLMTGGRGPEGKGAKRKFEEADIANLHKSREKFMADLAFFAQQSRKAAAEETLQNELSGLEQRLAYAKHELRAFEQNLASKQKELDHEIRQLNEVEPKYDEKVEELEALKANLKEFEDAKADVEDEIFATFCTRLGYENIRAYEAQQGGLEQEAAQKKNEFQLQRQTLESRLTWETSRLEATQKRLEKLDAQILQEIRDIEEYQAQKGAIDNEVDVLQATIDQLNEELNKQKAKYAKKTEKVTEARNELQRRSKNVESTLKAITSLETEVQRNSAGRYALLRRCKLEQIQIPLGEESNSLDSLPVESMLQADPDAMDIDDEEEAVRDYGIEVDFDELEDDFKEVSRRPCMLEEPVLTNKAV